MKRKRESIENSLQEGNENKDGELEHEDRDHEVVVSDTEDDHDDLDLNDAKRRKIDEVNELGKCNLQKFFKVIKIVS